MSSSGSDSEESHKHPTKNSKDYETQQFLDTTEFPARDHIEAKKRMEFATKLYDNANGKYDEYEMITLAAEINLMRDQIAWFRGFSDILGEDGKEDYFQFIEPGFTYVPD